MYVDDIIFGATFEHLCKEFATLMGNEFEMSIMGKLTFFLGLKIKQSLEGISIFQEKYTKELLKKFNMVDSKPIDTPTETNSKLRVDEVDPLVNQTMYRGIIGSLLYVTSSRPDIVYRVGMCSRFQACPRDSYLKATKRILRYLKKIEDLVLFYPADDSFNIVVFVDANFARYHVDKKSTSGMAHFLGSSLISWGTKKQNSVALSMSEAKYVVATSFSAQLLWIKQHLCVITPLLLVWGKSQLQHKRTKHIYASHHFLRDNVEKGNIVLMYCRMEDQIGDIFTKALSKDQFESNMLKLGMMNPN